MKLYPEWKVMESNGNNLFSFVVENHIWFVYSYWSHVIGWNAEKNLSY